MSRKINNDGFKPQSWETMGSCFVDSEQRTRKDTFARLYESMLTSPAFMSLNSKQKVLYLYCKSQYMGKRKPERDFPNIEAVKGSDKFYLSWAMVQKYELYKPSMSANFYNDMKVLCEHGLIEKVSSGKQQRMKSIYKFSGNWKTWNKTD